MNPWMFALFHHLVVFCSHFYHPSFLSCKYLKVPIIGPHASKVSDDGKSFLFLLSRKSHFELKTWGGLPSVESPLSPSGCVYYLGTCDGFSRRKLWWNCQLSTQRQWSECSFGNPKYSLFSSCGVLSSSIVRGHCHLVEKTLRGLHGHLGKTRRSPFT